jgi:sigma-B regulation protein RsbU (phosphoserine phosphatase)
VVSGDFYDFFQLSDQRLGIVIADVADKGIPAAILMAVSRTTIRATALSGRQPAEALSRASQLMLQDSQADMFLTAFYAVIDPADGQIVYANGGHNHPLLLRSAEQIVEQLSAPGILLGMLPNVQLENRDALMRDGDVVVFYTDGVTEAMNSDQQEYGPQRLRDTLLTSGHLNAGDILAAILNSVSEFTGNAAQSDDMTVVVVKRLVG